MAESEMDILVRYLQGTRDAVLWKLDGLSDYDARRPLTPTGSNILGLIKHLAYCETGYFGETFGRPFPQPLPAYDDIEADPTADMWAAKDESLDYIVDLYRSAWAHAAETFAVSTLQTTGQVPWWPAERNTVTVQQILVHMLGESARHAGQIDILRESIDGAVGLKVDATNLPEDAFDWPAYVARLEDVAGQFK